MLARDPAEEARSKRRGRPRIYGPLVVEALRKVWEAADHVSSKGLAPMVGELVTCLERHGELRLPVEVREPLLRMSATSIERHLREYRRQLPRSPFQHSPAVSTIQRQVPVRTFGEWKGVKPGSVQADLVAHCGVDPSGAFVVSLTMVDVPSSWIELRAARSKLADRVGGAVHVARTRLPMPLYELHTDNGGEFLNQVLHRYCRQHDIRMTRGRPCKKNDQAYVEQKNGAVVRRYVGYGRYQSQEACERLNHLYDLLRLYLNYFRPIRKLVSKERHGARVGKRYDDAATPYQRLLAMGVLDESTRSRLQAEYEALNPVRLLAEIAEAGRKLLATAEPHYGARA
jgi:transposase InsO family protein